jgi:hypothetical protein
MTQETAHNAARFAGGSKTMRCDKIHHNVVVVAGIKSNIAPRLRNGTDNIEGLVAIERSNFDGDHVLDFRELPPKTVGQCTATDGCLQVKADYGQDLGHASAVSYESVIICVPQRGQAQQASTVPEIRQQLSLLNGPRSFAAYAADANQRFSPGPVGAIQLFSGQCQYGFEEPVAWVPNCELRRMHPYRQAARTCSDIVATESPLTPLVKAPVCGERQWVCWNHAAPPQHLAYSGIELPCHKR